MTFLLVDDHAIFRQSFRRLLNFEFSNAVIFEACNGTEALSIVQQKDIDLIFLDLQMEGGDGYSFAETCLWQKPQTKIIILSMIHSMAVVAHFLKIGVKGYLPKSVDTEEVIKATKLVTSGAAYFHNNLDDYLSEKISRSLPNLNFSPREIEVMIKLSKGFTNKEIALQLGISARSVESYRANMIEKAKVKNTAELVRFFFENGLS
jgi:DNA-binding NarL/FixJ family response regulator